MTPGRDAGMELLIYLFLILGDRDVLKANRFIFLKAKNNIYINKYIYIVQVSLPKLRYGSSARIKRFRSLLNHILHICITCHGACSTLLCTIELSQSSVCSASVSSFERYFRVKLLTLFLLFHFVHSSPWNMTEANRGLIELVWCVMFHRSNVCLNKYQPRGFRWLIITYNAWGNTPHSSMDLSNTVGIRGFKRRHNQRQMSYRLLIVA